MRMYPDVSVADEARKDAEIYVRQSDRIALFRSQHLAIIAAGDNALFDDDTLEDALIHALVCVRSVRRDKNSGRGK